jgi:hypothetical protein
MISSRAGRLTPWMLGLALLGCGGGGAEEPAIVTFPTRTRQGSNALVEFKVGIPTLEGARSATSDLPIAWTAMGTNIYLLTALPPAVGQARVLADRLAKTAALVSPLAGTTLLPSDLITWRPWPAPTHRRVVVDARVVFREGYLEHLLTREEAGKNHESILSAAFDAEHLHLALLATGAQPGHPARFVNEKNEAVFTPATGDTIAVLLSYFEGGEEKLLPGQLWILNARDRRPLNRDWVFAGSYRGTFEDGSGTVRHFYAANEGRIICLANFPSALLDLPIESKDANPEAGGLDFIANSTVIPPLGTRVFVHLFPTRPLPTGRLPRPEATVP